MAKVNIMIVEDETIVAKDLKISLEDMGYTVTSIIKSGEQAIEKADQDCPDLILMDIRLKGRMDGIEAAELIRFRLGIPVVFLTAYADEEKLERAKLTMPFGYILKPFQDRDLEVTIKIALYTAKIDAKRKLAEAALYEAHNDLERKVLDRTEEMRRAKELAEAANIAKSNFIASMSHELRTPLNAIIGFSEILRDQHFGPLTEKQKKYVENVLESGKHLFSLINDILDLTNIEMDKIELKLSKVNIKYLMENCLNMIKEKALKHGINIDLHILQELKNLEIDADVRVLKQIMFNLLSNAVKFTPEGGAITIEVKQEREELIISVTDTGIGIAVEDQEKIFEEFCQVSCGLVDKTPGTGLGLTLAKRLVEHQGGRIWVESEGEGKGSSFRFTFPI